MNFELNIDINTKINTSLNCEKLETNFSKGGEATL